MSVQWELAWSIGPPYSRRSTFPSDQSTEAKMTGTIGEKQGSFRLSVDSRQGRTHTHGWRTTDVAGAGDLSVSWMDVAG